MCHEKCTNCFGKCICNQLRSAWPNVAGWVASKLICPSACSFTINFFSLNLSVKMTERIDKNVISFFVLTPSIRTSQLIHLLLRIHTLPYFWYLKRDNLCIIYVVKSNHIEEKNLEDILWFMVETRSQNMSFLPWDVVEWAIWKKGIRIVVRE